MTKVRVTLNEMLGDTNYVHICSKRVNVNVNTSSESKFWGTKSEKEVTRL